MLIYIISVILTLVNISRTIISEKNNTARNIFLPLLSEAAEKCLYAADLYTNAIHYSYIKVCWQGKILHDVRRVHVMEQRDTDDFNLSIFTGYIVTFLLTAD